MIEPQQYRKKPVVIEAMRYDGTNWPAICQWADEAVTGVYAREGIFIRTLEGTMLCAPGDWIIKGVKGEFYPCKDDIFQATYEAVNG